MIRRAASATTAAAIAVLLAGCVSSDSLAGSLTERIAIGIADDVTPQVPEPLDAEYVAWWGLQHPRTPRDVAGVEYSIDVLSWAGNTADEDGARIELRIGAHILPRNDPFSIPAHTEGSATRCWIMTIRQRYGYDPDSWRLDEESCPDGARAARPTPDSLLTMPEDAEEELVAVLSAAASPEDLADRLHAAFPDPGYSLDSREADGRFFAMVRVQRRDCISAVRDETGEIRVDSCDAALIADGG